MWTATSFMSYIYIQGAYKLSEDFAKPYVHKYWTEIHDVTTIWKRNVCGSIVTLNAFDVRPTCDTAHKTCLRGFGRNGSIAWTSAVSHVGRTSNAFKVTMKLQTFLFQMVVTSCISVQYLWKYGFARSSDNLYPLCINATLAVMQGQKTIHSVFVNPLIRWQSVRRCYVLCRVFPSLCQWTQQLYCNRKPVLPTI